MLRFSKAKHPETGREMLVASAGISEVLDPLQLLRALKQQFPDLYQQVGCELHLPPGVQQKAADAIQVDG